MLLCNAAARNTSGACKHLVGKHDWSIRTAGYEPFAIYPRTDLLYPCPGTRTNCNTSALTAAGRSYLHRFQCNLQHRWGFLRVQYCHGFRKSCSKRPGELSRRLAMFLPGIFTTFLLFSNFLLLFAQNGGAILNYGTLTVKYGNFTGNSAANVCILAPHSQRSQLAISLPHHPMFPL